MATGKPAVRAAANPSDEAETIDATDALADGEDETEVEEGENVGEENQA